MLLKEVQMLDLAAEYERHQEAFEERMKAVLLKGQFIGGEEVWQFERSFADFLGTKHVISCANGTDALQLALMALAIKAGDEVIIPAFCYVSVIEVICLLGATPVLVDVEETYFQMDAKKVAQAISSKTKAIIPVHLFGQCGNLEEILAIANKHQCYVIEDAAQAIGGTYKRQQLGTIGHIACTSFFPSKNLACFGDGGAVMTNDDFLAKKIRMMANHGQEYKYQHDLLGINSRLDTLQAAVLNVKLTYFEETLQKKKKIAKAYSQQLSHLKEITLPQTYISCTHSWHQFTVLAEDRDALRSFLKERGIPTMVYYPQTLNQHKAYQHVRGEFPVAQQLSAKVLSLPIHYSISSEDIVDICHTIQTFYERK